MATSEKIDLFKLLKLDFKQTKKPILLETTPGQYLAINGKGRPGGKEFQQAVEALYSMAYTIKMTRKANGLGDYVVCKLEALWWTEGEKKLPEVDKSQWQWKLMIRTPDIVLEEDVVNGSRVLLEKGKAAAVGKVALEQLDEGLCVQILHTGAYDKMDDTIGVMTAFMNDQNVVAQGAHHEIYISDPRRAAPEKLKTLLRQPVRKIELS